MINQSETAFTSCPKVKFCLCFGKVEWSSHCVSKKYAQLLFIPANFAFSHCRSQQQWVRSAWSIQMILICPFLNVVNLLMPETRIELNWKDRIATDVVYMLSMLINRLRTQIYFHRGNTSFVLLRLTYSRKFTTSHLYQLWLLPFKHAGLRKASLLSLRVHTDYRNTQLAECTPAGLPTAPHGHRARSGQCSNTHRATLILMEMDIH